MSDDLPSRRRRRTKPEADLFDFTTGRDGLPLQKAPKPRHSGPPRVRGLLTQRQRNAARAGKGAAEVEEVREEAPLVERSPGYTPIDKQEPDPPYEGRHEANTD